MIEIKNRFNGSVILTINSADLMECIGPHAVWGGTFKEAIKVKNDGEK